MGRAGLTLCCPSSATPDPIPTPLTAASPFCSVTAGCRRKGEAPCTTTHSPPILKPGEGGNRVQPKAAQRLPPEAGAKDTGGQAGVSRALTSVVMGFLSGPLPPSLQATAGLLTKQLPRRDSEDCSPGYHSFIVVPPGWTRRLRRGVLTLGQFLSVKMVKATFPFPECCDDPYPMSSWIQEPS